MSFDHTDREAVSVGLRGRRQPRPRTPRCHQGAGGTGADPQGVLPSIMEIVDLFRPIAKWDVRIELGHVIPETVRKA